VNREEIQKILEHVEGTACPFATLKPEKLADLCRLALRALEPARVICPSPRQDCDGCPHGIEHDHGDCEALDDCPGCVEVKP